MDGRAGRHVRGRSRRLAVGWCVVAGVLVASPLVSLAQAPCAGDCDGVGGATLNEVILCVRISLGAVGREQCPSADVRGDGQVGIDDLVSAVQSSVHGCSAATATPSASPTASPSPTATKGSAVPTEREALEAWLAAGSYLGWAAEGSIHPPNSPHPSMVRVFVNDLLFQSLEEGRDAHPAGAAAVKEIYGPESDLRGWAVIVKLEEESDGGQGWYWFERVGTFVFADGRGQVGCTGCHSLGTDYFRTPFPLSP